MNEHLAIVRQTVLEGKSGTITGTALSPADAAIPLSAVTALTLTLLSRLTTPPAVVNGVARVNILNVGRGTMHATSGLITVNLTPADNAILTAANPREPRTAFIEWTYNGPSGAGADKGGMYILFDVVNGDYIP